MSETTGFGASLPRLEAWAKASGTAQYCADLYLPNMLHGAILTSPLPHARIASYEVTRARALPGVRHLWRAQGTEVAADTERVALRHGHELAMSHRN